MKQNGVGTLKPLQHHDVPGTFLRAALALSLLLGLIALSPWARAADDPLVIEPSLDRNPVPINESFTLTFAASVEPDGDPDFSPLSAKFEILHQTRGSSYSMVNGSIVRKYSWQLQLMAKEAGTLEIPALAFGKDRSRPIKVTVVWGGGARNRAQGPDGAQDGPGILVELDAAPRNPYVQAQVIVTVRVLSRMAFSGDLGQPEVPGILLEKLDPDRQYTAVRNGLQYRVDERRYAMFPQKSGALTVPPVDLTGEYVDPSNPFPRPGQRKFRLRTEQIALEVRPIPEAFTGKTWLPASKLVLKETWKPDTGPLVVGDAVTRSVSLKADGASSGMLPEIESGAPAQAFRTYPDQPVLKEDKTGSGLSSVREQKMALIPLNAGTYQVAGIEVPWWNTVEDRLEIARLPARTLVIAAGDPKASPSAAAPPEAELPVIQAQDSREQGAPLPETATLDVTLKDPWFWVSVGLGVLWVLTLFYFWWTRSTIRRTPSGSIREIKGAEPSAALLSAVREACRQGDQTLIRSTLDAWSRAFWPQLSDEERLRALKNLIGKPMQDLERSLYGGERGKFEGNLLWSALEQGLSRKSDPRLEGADLLEPLWRS